MAEARIRPSRLRQKKIIEATTVTWDNPPLICPISAEENFSKLSVIPLLSLILRQKIEGDGQISEAVYSPDIRHGHDENGNIIDEKHR